MNTASNESTVKKDRSPPFPFISLKVAMERMAAFEEYFKRHPAPADKAGLAWKLKETSSQAGQTLAALKSFGLIDYEGSGPKRLAKLTDEARVYLRAQQESVKQDLLKRFALKPKPFAKYWETWRADRPADPICLDQLTIDDIFTESAAQTFLRVYDETIAFAGLGESDLGDEKSRLNADKGSTIRPKVGDWVQWESGGQIQFVEPRRVRAISEADGRAWIFVDGSETGIPADEVTVEKPAGPGAENSKPPAPFLVESKESKEREWLRGPLSRDVSYRLIVTGELGPKEIGKLIKLLEAQKLVLDDDDSDT